MRGALVIVALFWQVQSGEERLVPWVTRWIVPLGDTVNTSLMIAAKTQSLESPTKVSVILECRPTRGTDTQQSKDVILDLTTRPNGVRVRLDGKEPGSTLLTIHSLRRRSTHPKSKCEVFARRPDCASEGTTKRW